MDVSMQRNDVEWNQREQRKQCILARNHTTQADFFISFIGTVQPMSFEYSTQ